MIVRTFGQPGCLQPSAIRGIALAVFLSGFCVAAQNLDRIAPKLPRPELKNFFEDLSPSEPFTKGDGEVLVPQLKGIVVLGSSEAVIAEGVPHAEGIIVNAPEFLKRSKVEQELSEYLGKPVSAETLRRLISELVVLCRQFDHPVVDVYFPEQQVEEGVLQVIVVQGKVNRLIVENPGKKWVSDDSIRNEFHLQPGDPIIESSLAKDLVWVNRNPLLKEVDVQLAAAPAPDGAGGTAGTTDIILNVKDRLPLRLYAGIENSGTKILGRTRIHSGFNWADVFGLEHQLSYQQTRDIGFDRFEGHAATYVLPFPWRHTFHLLGAWTDVEGDLGEVGFPGVSQVGENWQASVRYSIPLNPVGRVDHSFSFGFDYKRVDSFLEFMGNDPLMAFPTTEIAQFVAGYRWARSDSHGQTEMNLEGVYSPGGLTSRNSSTVFNEARASSDPEYFYTRFHVERTTLLWRQFSLQARASTQWSAERLLPSEQFGIGGYDTVRGYEERLANGDSGLFFNLELWTPPIPFRMKGDQIGSLHFLLFYDYGHVQLKSGNEEDLTLSSIGIGGRFQIKRNLAFRADYGWQLHNRRLEDRENLGSQNGRFHFGLVASF